jgi:hypothetical protein
MANSLGKPRVYIPSFEETSHCTLNCSRLYSPAQVYLDCVLLQGSIALEPAALKDCPLDQLFPALCKEYLWQYCV